MYNAGGAARPAPLITQTPLFLHTPPPPSLFWYFSQGVSPFHDWRNISSQSGLFCIKTTPHLHNLILSSSLLITAREGRSLRSPSSSGGDIPPQIIPTTFSPLLFIISSHPVV